MFTLQVCISQHSPSAHSASGANLHVLGMQHRLGQDVVLPQSHSSPTSKIPLPHLAPPNPSFGTFNKQ